MPQAGIVRIGLLVFVLSCIVTHARADDIAAAREHFKNGTKAYDLGHYIEAAKE